jgi:hypothetical protein
MTMPYFVYKVFADKRLEYMDVYDKFQDAKTFARERRAELGPDADHIVKVVFAGNEDQARVLLTMEREPRPLGEDA